MNHQRLPQRKAGDAVLVCGTQLSEIYDRAYVEYGLLMQPEITVFLYKQGDLSTIVQAVVKHPINVEKNWYAHTVS
jgi:hypothetical protein